MRSSVIAAALMSAGSVACAAQQREDVAFAISHNTVVGQSVYVYGDVAELGNNNPANAVKLEPGSYPLWRATVAIPAGKSFSYQYTWRNDSVSQWSNASNNNPIGTAQSGATNAPDEPPGRHVAYYHSGWNPPMIVWRIEAGSDHTQVMQQVGVGRAPNEYRWKATGLGRADREVQFYFTDGANGRDPASGRYRTTYRNLFVQDGHVFDYLPPATVSNPQQINVSNFPSAHLGENRPYRVLLPRGYQQNATRRYPVLYLHDGQNVFDMGPFGTWNADETANALIKGGQVREVIIVAMDNTANRIWDYMPPDDIVPFGPGAGTPGRANKYAAYMLDELKPVIDATYRTLTGREDTAALGSSMGGIVSLYLGWDHNDRVGRIGAMSGAWQFPNFPNRVKAGAFRELRTYLDSGDSGSSNDNAWPTMSLRDSFLHRNWVLKRDLEHVVGYGHQHNEAAWAARFPGALKFLFPAHESPNELVDGPEQVFPPFGHASP